MGVWVLGIVWLVAPSPLVWYEDMDPGQSQGAALLRLLHLLWLLPHSWTAPEGMTVSPRYFNLDGVSVWGTNSELLKKSSVLCKWWEIWDSGNSSRTGEEINYGWLIANNVRGLHIFCLR